MIPVPIIFKVQEDLVPLEESVYDVAISQEFELQVLEVWLFYGFPPPHVVTAGSPLKFLNSISLNL